MRSKPFVFLQLIVFVVITCFILYLKTSFDINKVFSFVDTLPNSSLKNVTQLNLNARIFCIVLTAEKNLKTKAATVFKTWVRQCDNYKFVTIIPEYLKNSTNLTGNFSTSIELKFNDSFDILQPADLVNDVYDELSSKVFLTFRDVYQRYPGYDWYLKADDDTFVFVDNLRDFVKGRNPRAPITFGYNFKVYVPDGYHSGGAGYLLSQNAFEALGKKLSENFTFCKNTGIEDVDVNSCLRKLGVRPGKSIDEHGKERFHALNILDYYNGYFPSWLYSNSENYPQKGLNCCSDSSISFHYMSESDNFRLSQILENFKNSSGFNKRISFEQIINEFYD